MELLPTGEVQIAPDADVDEAARQAVEEQAGHRERRREKRAAMENYAEAATCRREILLRYFGDDYQGPCANCDNCETRGTKPSSALEGGTRREVA